MNLEAIAPQFLVEDVRRAAEHYRDKLGFDVAGYFLDPPVFAMVKRDGLRIQLARAEGPTGGSNRRWKSIAYDAYIWVDDVDALHAELVGRGAEILGPPQVRVYGMKELEVRDADGYLICFGADAPRAG